MRHGTGILALLAGCAQENGVFEQMQTDTWTQAPTDQVDILFVIDDSNSMMEEQATIAAGFTSFMSEMVAGQTDFHIAAVSTSFEYDDPARGVFLGEPKVLTKATPDYAALFQSRVQVGTAGSDKEKGLESAAYALGPVMASGPNAGFLRRDAFLLVVFLSDEDDCSDEAALEGMEPYTCFSESELLVPVSEYTKAFWALKERKEMVRIGVIVGPYEEDGACPNAYVGTRYLELAAAMGGLAGDICDADYSGILSELGIEATGVLSSFPLTDAAKPDSIVVTVEPDGADAFDVPADPVDGWTYDATTHYLTFHGAAVPPRGARLSASYTVSAGG